MPNSYNGWPVLTKPPLDNSAIPGTNVRFAPGVLSGDVATVLFLVGWWLNKNIEPAGSGCWGYAYRQNRNANNWSCHASATAIDYNAPRHPNGRRGTWGAANAARIRNDLLRYLEGVVQWGEDYAGTPDGMHFEIIKGAVDVARVAAKIRREFGPRENWAAGTQPAPPSPPGPSSGSQVNQDQFDLNDSGFPCTVDGSWGAQSIAACRNFQFAARRAVTGQMSQGDRDAIHQVPSWHSGGNIADDPGGYPASHWQQKLKDHGWHIDVDNEWGDHSKSILRQFQIDKGLTADGLRGPQSWVCLHCTVN